VVVAALDEPLSHHDGYYPKRRRTPHSKKFPVLLNLLRWFWSFPVAAAALLPWFAFLRSGGLVAGEKIGSLLQRSGGVIQVADNLPQVHDKKKASLSGLAQHRLHSFAPGSVHVFSIGHQVGFRQGAIRSLLVLQKTHHAAKPLQTDSPAAKLVRNSNGDHIVKTVQTPCPCSLSRVQGGGEKSASVPVLESFPVHSRQLSYLLSLKSIHQSFLGCRPIEGTSFSMIACRPVDGHDPWSGREAAKNPVAIPPHNATIRQQHDVLIQENTNAHLPKSHAGGSCRRAWQ